MKIVDRKTFLAMPEGTLFSKYQPCCFDDLCIKGQTVAGVDFYEQQIAGAIHHDDSDEYLDVLVDAVETGASISMDFDYEGRDGMFDDNQLFAVWEKADIDALKARLETVVPT